MKVRVYPMRVRGRRLPWREIENQPSHVGSLRSYRVSSQDSAYQAVSLQSGDPAETNPLPDLFEPVVTVFAPNGFMIRGYERMETKDGVVGVVQEWHCSDP